MDVPIWNPLCVQFCKPTLVKLSTGTTLSPVAYAGFSQTHNPISRNINNTWWF